MSILFGITMRNAFKRVQSTNMSGIGSLIREIDVNISTESKHTFANLNHYPWYNC